VTVLARGTSDKEVGMSKVNDWEAAGFTPEEAKDWRAAKFNPKEASEWQKFDFGPWQAKALKSLKLTPIAARRQMNEFRTLVVKVLEATDKGVEQ